MSVVRAVADEPPADGASRPEPGPRAAGQHVPLGAHAALAGSTRRGAPKRSAAPQTGIGTGYLGIAATTLAVPLTAFELARFAFVAASLPLPAVAAIAWVLLAGILVGTTVAVRRAEDRLPPVVGALATAGLALVVVLDTIASWSAHDPGRLLTAAPAAVLVLLSTVAARTTAGSVASLSVVGGLLIASVALGLLTGPTTEASLEPAADLLVRAIAPPLIAVFVVLWFRRTVARELERVLVQSTVQAPRFAVGMLASEELARLDDAAEHLLDAVATGRERLPLRPAAAQSAAHLATELRLHLIANRRHTWLYHAISESEVLGRQVTLSDPDSLAGLLDQRQRDGLLQAVWLLLGDTPDRSRRSARRVTVEVTIGPADVDPLDPQRMLVPIAIDTNGVPRRGVDVATWDAVRSVGGYTDTQRGGSVCIEIACSVSRPAG